MGTSRGGFRTQQSLSVARTAGRSLTANLSPHRKRPSLQSGLSHRIRAQYEVHCERGWDYKGSMEHSDWKIKSWSDTPYLLREFR